jgi:hypothetical protein
MRAEIFLSCPLLRTQLELGSQMMHSANTRLLRLYAEGGDERHRGILPEEFLVARVKESVAGLAFLFGMPKTIHLGCGLAPQRKSALRSFRCRC